MISFFKKDDKDRKKPKQQQQNKDGHTSYQNPLSTSSLDQSSTLDVDDRDTDHSINQSTSNQSVIHLINRFNDDQQQSQETLAQNQQQVSLPPKPKKGILKTMSKFGIGNGSASNGSNGNSVFHLKDTSLTKISNPSSSATLQTNIKPSPSPRTSLYTDSVLKRNNQAVINITSNSSCESQQASKNTYEFSAYLLPKLKPLSNYIISTEINLLGESSSSRDILNGLIRTINVTSAELSSIYLNRLDSEQDFFSNYGDEENSPYGKIAPIVVSSSLIVDQFLPGDQLISINDDLVLNKSIDDVRSLIEKYKSSDPTKVTSIKVRTCLSSLELIIKNTTNGLTLRNGTKLQTTISNIVSNFVKVAHDSPTLKKSSSSAESLDDNLVSDRNGDSVYSDCVWFVHTNGYSSANILSTNKSPRDDAHESNGHTKYKILLDNGMTVEVNDESLEKSNPSPQFDFCEDLSHLRFINEASVLHTIRQRYHVLKLIHNYLGGRSLLILRPTLASMNPEIVSSIRAPNFLHLVGSKLSSIYNDQVISLFKGCKTEDMPPHIYSYTQNVYRNMLSSRQDQTIVLMGHSGSGKTENSKLVLNYLFKVSTPSLGFKLANNSDSSKNFSEIKLNAMFCLLNSFCSVRTAKNINGANKFLNVFLLEFNHAGQITSLLLQLIGTDHTRIVYQPNDESNYLMFYYLMFCSDEIFKAEYGLNNDSELLTNNLFFQSSEDFFREKKKGVDFSNKCLEQIKESFKTLMFTNSEIKTMFSLLAAIIHLGKAGANVVQSSVNTPNGTKIGTFQNTDEAHATANLLGITYNQLHDCIFNNQSNNSSNGTRPTKYGHLSNRGSSAASPDTPAGFSNQLTPVECLKGFCIGLYQECINILANCINRAFKPNFNSNVYYYQQSVSNSMLIIDPPGFQYQLNDKLTGSYSDLICNYLNERFQLMFYQSNFINPIDNYTQEGLDVDLIEHIPESPSHLVNWLDKPPTATSLLHHRANNVSSMDSPISSLNKTNIASLNGGLLWLIEEQMSYDQKSPKELLKKLAESDPKKLFFSPNQGNNFTIYHKFGQFPVQYNLDVWLDKLCKDFNLSQRNLQSLLLESKKEWISSTFMANSSNANSALSNNNDYMSSNNPLSINNTTSLKRQASVRKMLTLSKRKTFTINFKLQIDSLFDSMRRTKCNFTFCFISTTNDSYDQQNKLIKYSSVLTSPMEKAMEYLDVPLLRNQLKAYQILASCRMYRLGFPEHLSFGEFKRRYSMFLNSLGTFSPRSLAIEPLNGLNKLDDNHKESCLALIKTFDLDHSLYKIGTTQIFFKAGVLAKLDSQRDEKLNNLILKLQAHCRQYLAIKATDKRRIQLTAIKCIQKNIRISFALKNWKWWKLYTNLMPIINVQNTETLLKQTREELDDIKRKNERLLNEKNELKLLNSQLENKFMNLQSEFVEEHTANAGTIDLLEIETSERMRLERELNELKPLYSQAIKQVEKLENETLELRLANSKNLKLSDSKQTNMPSSQETDVNSLVETERLRKEVESLKNLIREEKENSQAFNLKERAFFESKLKEKAEELLESEKQAGIHKRKYQKLCEEVQDLQRLCDDSKARNRELEKIQQKFDTDINMWKSKLEAEKEMRERIERERDSAKYELFTLKGDLENQKLENTYLSEKCQRLEKDLKDYEVAASSLSASSSCTNLSSSANPGTVSTSATASSNGLSSHAILSSLATTASTADQFVKMKSMIREMETKIRDQEEELDDQQGTIQQLEQAKLRLEMQIEKEKTKWQREIAEKESEMDDLRFHTQKKIKAIEMQLEEESELNSGLQREKREIERKLRELMANSGRKICGLNDGGSNGGSSDCIVNSEVAEYISKLKRLLLKYKTLAIDAQTQLENMRENIPKQNILKTLKSQLEDSEISKANALKSKQLLQVEISDLMQQLEEANLAKLHLEEQTLIQNRELTNLKCQMDEQERETDDILKKYQTHLQNYTIDSHRTLDLSNQIDSLTVENRMLKDQIRELEEKVNFYENDWIDKSELSKLESKLRDLECKYEFECSFKNRLQNQLERVKLQYDKSISEIETTNTRERKCEESLKKSQRQYKETLAEIGDLKKKVIDLEETKKRLDQQNEILERELQSLRAELKVNQNRIAAFQTAFNTMNEDCEDEDFEEDLEYQDDEDDDDDSSEVNSNEDTNNHNDNHVDKVATNSRIGTDNFLSNQPEQNFIASN